MKRTPPALAVCNALRVHRSATAKQNAADAFRRRHLDAAIKRLLKNAASSP